MTFESLPRTVEPAIDQFQEYHQRVRQYLGDAYNENKVNAITAVRGWDAVLEELAGFSKEAHPASWYDLPDNAACLELFGHEE